jgi:hypothetical protein
MRITDDAQAESLYDFASMRFDRTEGLAYLSEPRPVYEVAGKFHLTTTDAVGVAQRNRTGQGPFAVSALIPLSLGVDPPHHAKYDRESTAPVGSDRPCILA